MNFQIRYLLSIELIILYVYIFSCSFVKQTQSIFTIQLKIIGPIKTHKVFFVSYFLIFNVFRFYFIFWQSYSVWNVMWPYSLFTRTKVIRRSFCHSNYFLIRLNAKSDIEFSLQNNWCGSHENQFFYFEGSLFLFCHVERYKTFSNINLWQNW